MKARIIWTGPSALDGKPIALLAKIGGNDKVNKGERKVIGFAVVSMALVRQITREEHATTHTGHMGGVYLNAIKPTIDSVCDDACALKKNRKCYAQFNAQSTTEAVAMVRQAFIGRGMHSPSHGTGGGGYSAARVVRTLDHIVEFGGLTAGDFWRSMIVGSAAAIPVGIMRAITKTMKIHGLRPLAYVEAWRTRPDLRSTHMASCATQEDLDEAIAAGWRAFYSGSAEDVGNVMPDGLTMCPGSKYYANAGRRRISCTECGLCDGATEDDKRRSIWNPRHGNGDASRVSGLVRRGVLGSLIINGKGRTVGAFVQV